MTNKIICNVNDVNDINDINDIKNKIIKSHNCRLVLYLKYENLSCKISTIQVVVIIASTIITFFETLKKQMNFSPQDLRVISISLSTFIAMILSIARYLKMDETKEDIYKLLQSFSMVEKELKTIKDNHMSLEELEIRKIIEKFNEYFTLFNTILSYNENIYYRRQILNMSFEDKINDIYERKIQELESISVDKLNRYQRTEIIDTCLRNVFGPACCFVHRYKYNIFFKEYDFDIENKNKLIYTHEKTIIEKCCEILYTKCNQCLDIQIDKLNNPTIVKQPGNADEENNADEEKDTKVFNEKVDVGCFNGNL